MADLTQILPWLVAMALLIGASAFFSASEAALFYLRSEDRLRMRSGNRAQQLVDRLLEVPDRVLSAVLFWNLVVNLAYFALASIAGMKLPASLSVFFAAGALLCIIFFSEMLPKSIAVLIAPNLASLVSMPLAVMIRILDPVMPAMRTVNFLSQRMLWPRFKEEAYLEVADLERAIELSTSDAKLIRQEREALRNIVHLSEIRADEWMRPRNQFRTFQSPVSIDQLEGQLTPSGYVLISENNQEEIDSAVNLKTLFDVPQQHLEYHAQPVAHIPWCATVADALEKMQRGDRQVAVIVNEFGDTVGILTLDDILETVFSRSPTRSGRLLNRPAVQELGPGRWRVVGLTSLRRLARYLGFSLPSSKSVTVSGLVHEQLERLPQSGDECEWGPFRILVRDAPQRGHLVVELHLRVSREELE
ncbi:MAG: hemolysin activation protein [Planctomycetaceae bacterium]|nr:hemolysin activation protein [Planctomycetaceae bacterium]